MFTNEWLHTKMRLDRVGDNVRLKAGNLKKVLSGIQDYNADVLGIRFNKDFPLPDIQAASQGDKLHLSKLFRHSKKFLIHEGLRLCNYVLSQKKYATY